MKRNRKWFWAALFIPLFCLAIVAAKPIITLLFGEDIVLSTSPVDPTDLFYGDYLILSYDIEEAPDELVDDDVKEAEYSAAVKKPLYLWLEKKKNMAVLTRISFEKPGHSLYLTAEFTSLWLNEETNMYNVSLPWERYYVPENQGLQWEERARQGDILVHMKIRNGFAVPTSIE